MSDPEIQFEDPAVAPADGTSQSSGKSTDASTRQLTVSVLLGLLAGEGDHPREGERDIVASAIRRALELSSQREFPSLARLIAAEGREEIDQRAARCRHNDMSMWGNYQDAPVLALCVEIHRNGFVDADGKEARCKLFLALVDLASSCTDLLASKSFKSAATGLRLLLATEEAFEIVRRRLFAEIRDPAAKDKVCRAFADHYVTHAADLPGETQEGQYLERMRAAYPIHPEVFERLYKDWSTLPNFQRTRGVLKLMAKVIHRLWQDNNQDLLLMPGNLPLYDGTVRSDLTAYLPPGWDPVLERDVDGERSEPALIEQSEQRFGAVQACRRVTRSIFLGSAPTGSNETARGLETARIVLGSLQPGQAPHVFEDALGRLEGRLTYLSKGNARWWLDVRPNLRQEMEDRKKRFDEFTIKDEIRQALTRVMGTNPFDAVHYFTPDSDIPDNWDLRLVILSPDSPWTRSGPNAARDQALRILRSRGEQPRQKQNRLLFLAADTDQVSRLKDTVRVLLAWRSIEADIKDYRLTLDNQQARQATQSREQAQDTLLRLVREAYRWLVAPIQLPKKGGGVGELEWEPHALNAAAAGLGRELDRVVVENELVIQEWAPIHLGKLLQQWYWKDDTPEIKAVDVWQHTCEYLYLPRLAKSTVLQTTIAAGASSPDFFGLAYGKTDDGYQGFSLGRSTSPLMNELLLIEPGHAAKHEASMRAAQAAAALIDGGQPQPGQTGTIPPSGGSSTTTPAPTPTAPSQPRPTRYFGTVDLDPVKASLQFSTLVSELVELFSTTPGTSVRIRVDIEAEDSRGFAEGTVRAAKENSRTLKVEGDFE